MLPYIDTDEVQDVAADAAREADWDAMRQDYLDTAPDAGEQLRGDDMEPDQGVPWNRDEQPCWVIAPGY